MHDYDGPLQMSCNCRLRLMLLPLTSLEASTSYALLALSATKLDQHVGHNNFCCVILLPTFLCWLPCHQHKINSIVGNKDFCWNKISVRNDKICQCEHHFSADVEWFFLRTLCLLMGRNVLLFI